MPLSEHEQRLLDQIERALYQDDPKFATTVRSTDLRTHMRRRMIRAGVVLGIGFTVMFTGVVSKQPLLGVVGFLVMLGALLLALSAWKRLAAGPAQAGLRVVGSDGPARQPAKRSRAGKTRPARSNGSVKGRLEERWKRRWDERGEQR